jgi:cellulose synthase/poly-beta-1,6-N-acetylglucosamine synthase-like glycosyltransferase
VPGLIAALGRLDYPADRLRILIVVEADDVATRAALRGRAPATRFETLVVPTSEPRTKPKALAFALATVEADLIAVFDAEDRPDPLQLRKAAAAFAAGPADLVCVQAALVIDHAGTSRPWLVRQFALEYAMLFQGILPFLARFGGFFLLGGTSNHFRRDALVAVGGWDPHNVTEDADIAVRLARAGGRLGIVASSTGEEAPLGLRAWHGQRTRWMKGWLQTWLVHMRAPAALLRQLGPGRFAAFHLLLTGQILSALVHPFGVAVLLAAALFDPAFLGDRSFVGDLLLATCILGGAVGVAGSTMLALRVRGARGPGALAAELATLPLYWLLLSTAAVAALRDLARHPHRWTKTDHGLARRNSPLAETPPVALSVVPRRV